MRRRLLIPAITALIGLLVGGASVAFAQIGAGGTINGCYQRLSGQLRVIDPGDACRPSEIAIAWNATGAAGAVGATGATGASGANGTNGTNGTNGLDGATGATGPVGPNGVNGTNGATGPKGDTGITGATGPQGPAGTGGGTAVTFYQAFGGVDVPALQRASGVARCDAGDHAIAGGFAEQFLVVEASALEPGVVTHEPEGWSVSFYNPVGISVHAIIYATCAH